MNLCVEQAQQDREIATCYLLHGHKGKHRVEFHDGTLYEWETPGTITTNIGEVETK